VLVRRGLTRVVQSIVLFGEKLLRYPDYAIRHVCCNIRYDVMYHANTSYFVFTTSKTRSSAIADGLSHALIGRHLATTKHPI